MLRRRKLVILLLLLYWPGLFVLTHMPMPSGTRGVSDKSLHFMAFLVLAFFLWSAFSGGQKIKWNRSISWITLGIALLYGALDEYLQTFVGRDANIYDFFANAAGALTALLTMTFLGFWASAVSVCSIVLFVLVSFSRVSFERIISLPDPLAYMAGYAILTAVWLRYVRHHIRPATNLKWWLWGAFWPVLVLIVTEITADISDSAVTDSARAVLSAAGILLTISTAALTAGLARRWTILSDGEKDDTADRR